MTKEEFLKKLLDDADAVELDGEDITWLGGKLIGEGFSRIINQKFAVRREDLG